MWYSSCCRVCESTRGTHHAAKCDRATAVARIVGGEGSFSDDGPAQIDVSWLASGKRVATLTSVTLATVYDLKCAIHAAAGIPKMRQELVKDGRKLEDAELLEKCGVLSASPSVSLVAVERPTVLIFGTSVLDPRTRDEPPSKIENWVSIPDSCGLPKLASGRSVMALDCKAECWRPLPPMSVRRQRPKIATMNGKVYVVGGCSESSYIYGSVDVLEVLDVKDSSWEIIPNGHIYDYNVTLAAMDGSIYVIDSSWAGAWSPEKRSWTSLPSLPALQLQENFAMAPLGGQLYAVFLHAFSLEPDARTWSALPTMAVPRLAPEVAVIRGMLYVFGGDAIDLGGASLEVFNPSSQTWTELDPHPGLPASNWAVAVHGDQIYVVGGYYVDDGLLSNEEASEDEADVRSDYAPGREQAAEFSGVYKDSEGGVWILRQKGDTVTARLRRGPPIICTVRGNSLSFEQEEGEEVTGTLLNNVITWSDDDAWTKHTEDDPEVEDDLPLDGFLNTAAVFDTLTRQWTELPPMVSARAGHSAVSVGNELWVIGGDRDSANVTETEVWDKKTSTWCESQCAELPEGRFNFSAVVLPEPLWTEEDECLSRTCVVCMENAAFFVCTNGHLILCRQCRRKLVLQALRDTDPRWQRKSKRDLNAKQLDRTPVSCPICRAMSPLILVGKFEGQVLVM